MTIKEYVTDVIQSLEEAELREVADYLAFLRFRARAMLFRDPMIYTLALLYREFGEEDRNLAEEGMAEYEQGLWNTVASAGPPRARMIS